MGWWDTGEDGSGNIGDDPANAVTAFLVRLPSLRANSPQPLPDLQVLLDSLAAALRSDVDAHDHHFKGLRAKLSNGVELTSRSDCHEGPTVIEATKDLLVELNQIYQEAFERSPTLREIVDNFAFVLGFEPSRFLAGLERVEVTDIRPD